MQGYKQVWLVIGAAAAALMLGACGGEDRPEERGQTQATRPDPAKPRGTPGGRPLRVRLREWRLDPATLRAPRGTVRIRAINRGRVVHALEVEGPSGEVETRELQPDERQTITVKLDRPGRYVMYCPVGNHRERGMRGTVIVS